MRKLLTPKDNGILGIEGGHSTCFMKTKAGSQSFKDACSYTGRYGFEVA